MAQQQHPPWGSSPRPQGEGPCALPTELGGLLPKLENLRTLHSIKVVFHASTNCYLCLFTSCLLCRLVPFCSCFLAFCSAFISFAPFSFVLTFFPCFLSFFVPFSFVLLLVSLSILVLFPFALFCFFFLRFVAFFRLCPCVPFFLPFVFFRSFGSFFSSVLLSFSCFPRSAPSSLVIGAFFPPEILQQEESLRLLKV